jgi:hypothetical protein
LECHETPTSLTGTFKEKAWLAGAFYRSNLSNQYPKYRDFSRKTGEK